MYKPQKLKFRSAQRIRVGIGAEFPALSLDKAIKEVSKRTGVEEHLFYHALNLGNIKIHMIESEIIKVSNAVELDPIISVSMFKEDGRLESQKGNLAEILLRRNEMELEQLVLSPWWAKFKGLFGDPPKKETGGMIFKSLRLKRGFITRGDLSNKIIPSKRTSLTINSLTGMINRLEHAKGRANRNFVKACCSWLGMSDHDTSDFIIRYLDKFDSISSRKSEKSSLFMMKGASRLVQPKSKKISDEDQIFLIEELAKIKLLFEMRDSDQAEYENKTLPEQQFLMILAKVLTLAYEGFLSELTYGKILKHLEFQLERVGHSCKLMDENLEEKPEEGSEEGVEEENVVALKPSRAEE